MRQSKIIKALALTLNMKLQKMQFSSITHHNFLSQPQQFFQQFYIWAKIFITIFLEKSLQFCV